jgi:hypothetical protein
LLRISRIEKSNVYTASDCRNDYRIQKNTIVELNAGSTRALLRTRSTVPNFSWLGAAREGSASQGPRTRLTLRSLALLAGGVAKAGARSNHRKRGQEIFAPRGHSP